MISLIFTFFLNSACAAPFPATSSSILTDPSKSLFFRGFGFNLQSPGMNWSAKSTMNENIFESVRFEPKGESASSSEAALSLRMDRLKDVGSLEIYARKWMRDYPSYGFEMLGTKSLTLGGGRAILVDLVQKNKNRQLRQVILQKNERVAVLTCLDRKDRFNETLQACNQLIKSFQWIDP